MNKKTVKKNSKKVNTPKDVSATVILIAIVIVLLCGILGYLLYCI